MQKAEGQKNSKTDEHRNLEWKCLTCDTSAPPTGKGYSDLLKHACTDRKIWLVDTDTGEQLANNIRQAQSKGLVAKKGEEGEVKEKAEKEVASPEIIGDGIIRYTVTLPADAFTLFNIVRATDLEKPDKLFDEWLWDCIRERIRLGYRKQLVLCDIEEAAT